MARAIADAKDDKGRGALHFSAIEGNMELCKYLLEELKLDVNPKDVVGDTPLHYAAGSAHIETAKYLIDRGADPVIPNGSGLTVLHHSAGSGNIELMNFILSKGINIDCQSSLGSPLFFSAGCAKKDAVKFLLEHHTNPNAETVDGFTALYASVTSSSLECLKLLIQWRIMKSASLSC
ncbi:putative ankyrin repeat protein RF_0381 [Rhodamnia argentea]|uniref:Ankyrin repeat protein RF_0381 n=1 Tax=Rhodamnia argentea TaxID=178133 RepID=A0ABM3HVW9_9MYRT|nr:putative ankyrin repeat protein RF_0381 [Rhodamnia argentea]